MNKMNYSMDFGNVANKIKMNVAEELYRRALRLQKAGNLDDGDFDDICAALAQLPDEEIYRLEKKFERTFE